MLPLVMRATASKTLLARQLWCRVDKPARASSQLYLAALPTRRCVKAYSARYERPVERFVTQEEVDLALRRAADQSEAWHRVTAAEKIDILERIRSRIIKCSLQMGRRGAKVCSATGDLPLKLCGERQARGYGLSSLRCQLAHS